MHERRARLPRQGPPRCGGPLLRLPQGLRQAPRPQDAQPDLGDHQGGCANGARLSAIPVSRAALGLLADGGAGVRVAGAGVGFGGHGDPRRAGPGGEEGSHPAGGDALHQHVAIGDARARSQGAGAIVPEPLSLMQPFLRVSLVCLILKTIHCNR